MSDVRYQAILFDLDGTLLDTAPDFITAINRLLSRKGLAESDPQKTRNMVTHGSAGIISSAFQIETDHPDFEPHRQEFLDLYLENLADKTTLFPGIAELLKELGQREIPWGIVTNKPLLYTDAILRQLPILPAPAAVICPDHVTRTKPDAEPVLLACQTLAVSPEHCLCIGDHQRDVQAGINAGTSTIAAAYGYLDADDDAHTWGADHVVTHSEALQAYIFE